MTNEDLNAISTLLDTKFDSMKAELSKELETKLDPINERLDRIDEQLKDIDSAIGMLADWADNVGIITRVPFASGQK